MKLKLWGPQGPVITIKAPPEASPITCGFDNEHAVGVMWWCDGVETPVCAPHQAWVFDCLDELDQLFAGVT